MMITCERSRANDNTVLIVYQEGEEEVQLIDKRRYSSYTLILYVHSVRLADEGHLHGKYP